MNGWNRLKIEIFCYLEDKVGWRVNHDLVAFRDIGFINEPVDHSPG